LKHYKKKKKNKMKRILNSNWMPWNSWPSMAAFLIMLIVGLMVACQHTNDTFDKEHNITRLPTGQRIYETVYKGKTYIIVETPKGVGICEK
jgi:hypothetical protein